jgi:hypothetical protein
LITWQKFKTLNIKKIINMIYSQKEPIKITIEGGFRPDKTIQLTLCPDADINDWIETFKTILIHQSFSETTIKELFEEPDYNESYEL